MKIESFLAVFAAFILLASTFSMVYKPFVNAQTGNATLTGKILDHGVDTNGNGLYDYLEIDVEVNVTVAGDFELQIVGLQDNQGAQINISNQTFESLNVGLQYMNVSLSGPQIFISRLNPKNVSSIYLFPFNSGSYGSDEIDNVTLSRVYSYAEFDPPAAYMTGNILDRGVDTNGNGLYDYLEVDVEINVTVAGEFQATIDGLSDDQGGIINVYNSSSESLSVGLQYMNVSLSGPQIFISRLNPKNVSDIELSDLNAAGYLEDFLGYMDSVSLSRVYNYTEFDRPIAYLTGNISDRGVDTDGDGLFNYLEVGVEVNVTEAGSYWVTAYGLVDSNSVFPYPNTFYDSEQDIEFLEVGVHEMYVNFSGPGIRQSNVNPAKIGSISLLDVANYALLDFLNNVPLSKTYDNALFDAPLRNVSVNFKVYPDATVAIDGTVNYTRNYPENTNLPWINATMGLSTAGNTTVASSNGTIAFPDNLYIDQNSVQDHERLKYQNGLLNETSSSSYTLTPVAAFYPFNATDFKVNAAFSGGAFNVDVEASDTLPMAESIGFPFNMTDATIQADFDGNTVTGNITFHIVPGLQFADVTLGFSGNRTNLQFAGDLNVTYANYGSYQINETYLDQKIADLRANFTGVGPESLYNETGGFLNCTNLFLNKTSWSDPTLGADVAYNATVVGNLTAALASLMYPQGSSPSGMQGYEYALLESVASSVTNASVVLNYYHDSQMMQASMHFSCDAQTLSKELLLLVPPAMSQFPSYMSSQNNQTIAILRIANATTYALESVNFAASYSSADRTFSEDASLLADWAQLKQDILPILPDLAPSASLHDVYESFFNTTYGNTTSLVATLDMTNGTGAFSLAATYQGDFNAEVNQVKSFYVGTQTYESESPFMTLINETEIDISNLQAQVSIGRDWTYVNFSGLVLKPPADKVDAITFKLKQMFGTQNSYTEPQPFEKITVTIVGESSGNQTLLLSCPPSVPPPSSLSDDSKTMVWDNVSFSNLQDLTFLAADREQVSFGNQNYDIPILTNSTVQDFTFDPGAKQISFNVTGEPGTGFCNVTIPRNLLNATAFTDWTVTFDGNVLPQSQYNITQNDDYVFIYLSYEHSEHAITITGTQLVPEFQPSIPSLALAMGMLLIITVLASIKKRKPIMNKFRQTLNTLRLQSKPH